MASDLVNSIVPVELRPWVGPLVRLGYLAKGVIYVLIGTFALGLAAGLEGGRLMNPSAALLVLLRQPFGQILLGVIGVGILTYAAWQFVEAICDTRCKGGGVRGWTDRSLTMIKGAAYGTIGWQAVRIVLGIRRARSRGLAADVMSVPLGDWFLVLVGLGVAVYGVFEIRNGWRSKFGDDLDERRLRREVGDWAIVFGRFGNVARGVILVLFGLAITRAGLDRSPEEAGGVAESMRTIFNQPLGGVLLLAVATGLVCFGIFQLLHARYAKL